MTRIRAPFADFRHPARIYAREESALTLSENLLLRFILARSRKIVARAQRKQVREWASFADEQGVNPFGDHSRIEIHLDKSGPIPGRWGMQVYWADDESWAGMHFRIEYFFEFPISFNFVF